MPPETRLPTPYWLHYATQPPPWETLRRCPGCGAVLRTVAQTTCNRCKDARANKADESEGRNG